MKNKIITLCGSTKFKDEFIEIYEKLSKLGHLVFTVGYFTHSSENKPTEVELARMKVAHLNKISMSDIIIVINKDDYIGESTRVEIEYAKDLDKDVIFEFMSCANLYSADMEDFINGSYKVSTIPI